MINEAQHHRGGSSLGGNGGARSRLKLAGYFSLLSVAHYLILDAEPHCDPSQARARRGDQEAQILKEGQLRLDPPGLEIPVQNMFPPAYPAPDSLSEDERASERPATKGGDRAVKMRRRSPWKGDAGNSAAPTELDNKGAYSVSCWVRCGYRHGRFPIVHIHLAMAQTLRQSPIPSRTQFGRAGPGPLFIALTVGVVASIPNERGVNPKRTWRQTQAGVAPNPNPCQLYPLPF